MKIDDDIEGYIKVSKRLIPLGMLAANQGENLLMLRARGNALTDFPLDGHIIEDGDYLMVLKGCLIESNDIVIMKSTGGYDAYSIILDDEYAYLRKNKGVRVLLKKDEGMALFGKVVKVFKMPH